jgi:hypothetical protein
MDEDIDVIEMYTNGEMKIRYTQLDGLTLPILFFPPKDDDA